MNSKRFMGMRVELESKCREVLEDRGPQYAGPDNGDRFANFKLIAELLGNFKVNPADPKTVLVVYMLKHIFSLLSYLGGTPEGLEKLEGRLVDIRNYVDLLYALLSEDRTSTDDPTYIPGQPCAKCGRICIYPARHTGRCCNCYAKDYPEA